MLPVADGAPTLVTEKGPSYLHDWFPYVSPDGTWMAYIAYGHDDVAPGDHPPNRDIEIRLVPAAGGASRTLVRLFGGQGTMNVNSWSPDSRALAFVSYRLKE